MTLTLFSVLEVSQRLLTLENNEPICYIDQLQTWRDVYLGLGQDVFTCAYLAYNDLRMKYERKIFTWSPIIKTDHPGLKRLFSKKLAENHCHLYGSSQTFALTWCNLMNYPESHKHVGVEFDKLLFPHVQATTNGCVSSTKDLIR